MDRKKFKYRDAFFNSVYPFQSLPLSYSDNSDKDCDKAEEVGQQAAKHHG